MTKKRVNVIGAGLSGLSAALTLARAGTGCALISSLPSERAQSVLAEGGINAALDTMGENDRTDYHYEDTMRGGCFLEAEAPVRGLTENAPELVRELAGLGVPFEKKDGRLVLRNFGGQAKKRTAYAKSSTGKMIMTALIDQVRRYEAEGLITRYPRHELTGLSVKEGRLVSITVCDNYTGKGLVFTGPTILCTGGLNGFFEGMTTGTTQNTGNAAALAFAAGANFANLEMIQYHPTTVGISNKRMLVSEAARGEGGRLFIMREGSPWYFMEEKYPELGNLMPRDVVSREEAAVLADPTCSGPVYLDMRGLDRTVWERKLSDLRAEIIAYMRTDPVTEPIAVSPGIHFFMGGIRVNDRHQTNIEGLLAAGEAACKYHGANRLGGNSMLAAVYGGRLAARTVLSGAGAREATGQKAEDREAAIQETADRKAAGQSYAVREALGRETAEQEAPAECDISLSPSSALMRKRLKEILLKGLGIIRTRQEMEAALEELRKLCDEEELSEIDRKRAMLGLAMIQSGLERKESRGAHFRTDYPQTEESFRKQSVARLEDGQVRISFESAEDQ